MQDPKDIFKKFSENSRQVLVSSQKIAQTMKTGIGSEHILLAMTVTSGSIAHEILKENMINIDQIKLIIRFNNLKSIHGEGLSRETKKILEDAIKKAAELKNNLVEPEHILYAIINDNDCLGSKIISRIGIDIENMKYQLEESMQDNSQLNEMMNKHIDSFLNSNIESEKEPRDFMFFGPNPIRQMQTNVHARPKNQSKTPMLDYFSSDLTNLAKNSQLDPVIGRQRELSRMIQILCRRSKNNPVLVGDPGVGKTAIVEGLAQRIARAEVPVKLQNKRLVSLDLAMIIAGTMYRGQFEERIKKIIEEISKDKNIIVFLDEIHTMVGAGSAEGSMDTANILKPALAKGSFRLIGATTADEYRKHIEKDSALERRLQPIKVDEPSLDESIKILKGIKARYEEHHQVKISDEAIEEAVQLSKRYISDRFLPDKAIDLIDEAAAALHILHSFKNRNKKIVELEKQLLIILKNKELEAEKQNYENAAKLKTQEIQIKHQIEKISSHEKINKIKNIVGLDEIAGVVALWTGIPVESLVKKEKIKILNLGNILKQNIIGQNEAIEAISQAIKRAKAGISDPNRPLGAFIFLGPTGVGKTELAKVLAHEVFGSEKSLIKIDMSEFMEKHNIARLVGAPPGYVGFDEAGKLTETVRKNPYSLVLLDEIEKAHPDTFNILLQILEDGSLTDAKGKNVNFKNTIIIMTSNLGTHEFSKHADLGFSINDPDKAKNLNSKYEEMKDKIISQLKNTFKPELINRLDKIIVFKPLNEQSVEKIVELRLEELAGRLQKQNINLSFDVTTIRFIAKKGFDPEFGARPIRRTIMECIEDPLSGKILSQEISTGENILVTIKEGKIFFQKK